MRMKKVIGVAAVIMIIVAIVLIAFSCTVAAHAVERTFTEEGGVVIYKGTCPHDYDDETTKISVYEGEKIYFVNEKNVSVAVTVSGPYKHDGGSVSDCADYSVKANERLDSDGMKTGYFFKVYNTSTDCGCWFGVDKQSFSVELVDDIDKVQETENFSLTLKKNNKKGGVMMLTIEDKEGYSIQNAIGTDIYKRSVNYTDYRVFEGNPVDGITNNTAGELVFDTTLLDMRKGTYKIILEDYATEVDDDVTITVEKWYLKIEKYSKEVIKGWEDIDITIHSSYYEKDVNVTVEGIPEWDEKTLTLDEEGKKRIKISTEKLDYGKYKVTVEVVNFTACAETRYVQIKKGKTSLKVDKKKCNCR